MSGVHRVLVVDDSRAIARWIGAAMSERGYEVLLAHSGQEAIATLAREPIDCVLLDMIMPGLSGEDTCRRIRRDPRMRAVPVIIVTGRDGDYTTEGIDAGADDYVAKSNDPRPLAARVRAQIRRRALERESRDKTAFLAMISHELRTPLNAVLGFASILGEEPLSDAQRLYLREMLGGANDLRAIVDRVVEFAELDAGTLRLRREELDVASVVRTVHRTLTALAAERRVPVLLDVDSSIPALNADRARVEQVLVALGSNAIKFSPTDAPIAVRAHHDAQHVVFVIQDRGPGIEPTDLPAILSGFEQVGRSILNKAPGIGIGVATSKKLVELHGGRLDIRSTRGEGTTVTVMLPAA